MILDLVRPSSGTVRILGSAYRDLKRPATRVGALLDASGFHPGRSGRNALRVVAAGAGISYDRVDVALEMVELTRAAKRTVKGYSSGMRQRLALAAALLGDPEVLSSTSLPTAWIRRASAGCAAFCRAAPPRGAPCCSRATCSLRSRQTAENVLIISKGALVAQGPIAKLAAHSSPVVRARSPQAERLEPRCWRGARPSPRRRALAIRGPQSAEVGELAHANGIALHELLTEQPSLEDLFLQLAGTRSEQS